MSGKLSAAKIAALKHNGKKKGPCSFADGNGLYLQVTQGGAKSWTFRYQFVGRERYMGLGSYGTQPPNVSLSAARIQVAEQRGLLLKGIDPLEHRAAMAAVAANDRVPTFAGMVDIWMSNLNCKNAKTKKDYQRHLEKYAYPAIASKPVDQIDPSHIFEILKTIWKDKRPTAEQIRNNIERIFKMAKFFMYVPRISINPAQWDENLQFMLETKTVKARPHPSLPWRDVPDFVQCLVSRRGMTRNIILFTILTGARHCEVRQATWQEIDFDGKVWTVPDEHSKTGVGGRRPLADEAIVLLRALRSANASPASLIFGELRTGRVIEDTRPARFMRELCFGGLPPGALPRWRDPDLADAAATVHGFRASFKAWSLDERYPDHCSEIQLLHKVGNPTRNAYARGDHLEERRVMMSAWAKHVLAKVPSWPHLLAAGSDTTVINDEASCGDLSAA